MGCGRIDFDPFAIDDGPAQLALGFDHSCAIRPSGEVTCWGNGRRGRLGNGSTASIGDDELPRGVLDLGGVATQISAGADHTCARLASGGVRCWGVGDQGRLGHGALADIGDDEAVATAGDIEVGGAVAEVAAGGIHTCARLETGAVRCWGSAANGRLGYANAITIGDDEAPSVAGDLDLGGPAIMLRGRGSHTCALLDSKAVRCWGAGSNGQLGYGEARDIGDAETPGMAGDVPVGEPVLEIAVGATHTCARLRGGAVRCWGSGANGRLGYGNTASLGIDETPAMIGDVPLGGRAIRLATGGSHTCALLDDGGVRCWGANTNGQLGYGTTADIGDDQTPADVGDVPLGGRAVDIIAGGQHTCAQLESGALRCWGLNNNGQLGYGNVETIGDDETPASAGDLPLD
jgi:alpha-tubulin suppressor-like RCC1 family protein